MRSGDTVCTPPGECHWHGGAREHFMTHLAMVSTGDAGDGATGPAGSRRRTLGPARSLPWAGVLGFAL
ncbi:hypothetical protein ADL12_36500 [Streptomyces regalis]|uniref:Cupin 2 conserved barrel domain-containing protein n=1 Tax=Streptomyces regalis TaxID=68262 RepID=A0A101JD56_9ACTN|nr:hypothetical protein ADL12_36500 [Streptomyces regalis]